MVWSQKYPLLQFSDLATCEQSRGCKGYSQEVVTNDTTRSWQAFVGIRPLWWFSSEVGHFNLGSSDVAFNLDGSYTDCLFRSSTCTGKFSERLSFNTSGNWIRTGFHVSLWEMDFSLSPGIAFTKIQTFNSYSAYNLTFPDGSVHTGEAHRNETKRKRIFTHTFGVSGEVVKGWHMGAEYTPYWRVRYMADQGGGNPPEKVDIKIQSLMFTFAKIFWNDLVAKVAH